MSGINIRIEESDAVDSVDHTYCSGNDTYPTTRKGITFGWVGGNASVGTLPGDIDARLKGYALATNNGTQYTLRIDLPSTGNYLISLASGSTFFTVTNTYIEIWDDTTLLYTFDDSVGHVANEYFDIQGNILTTAIWPIANLKTRYTFSSTILKVVIGTPGAVGAATLLNHVGFEKVKAGLKVSIASSREVIS